MVADDPKVRLTTGSPPTTTAACHPYNSALSMAKAIKDGVVTSRQLVEMYIARIERLDAKINAVIDRDFEGALRRADEADKMWRQAKEAGTVHQSLGVFHGVPMTIKEGNPTKGFRMTGGDPKMKFVLPKSLSNENTRILIEEAGCVLMGKTNLPINQCDWEAHNSVYGRTGNPYDPGRSPGGSSGGAAAALAAGFTPIELGSDIGGSIRIPAVMCGVVGHCITRGVNPSLHVNFGLPCCGWLDRLAKQFADPIIWMGRAGPMARNVEDVVAMVEVLGGDVASGLRRPKEGLRDYRVAVWRSHEISPPGHEVSEALNKAVAALKAEGVTVDELKPPVDPIETYTWYLRYLGIFMGLHLPKQQRQNAQQGRAKDSFPPDIRSPFWEMDHAAANGVPEGTKKAYEVAANNWDDFLKEHYDVVLCPIFPCESWPHASGPKDMLASAEVLSRKIVIDGEERYYGDGLFWPHLQVLCGLPATGFPVGFATSGLPVGLQAFGAKGSDFIVLDVVQKLMHALGMNEFRPPPGFA